MTAFLDSLDTGRIVSLKSAVALIGSGAECDLIIDHSPSISRLHCAIVQTDDLYFVRDLGSTNGVWTRGQRVVGQARLQNGQEFAVGQVQFIFRCGSNIRITHKPRTSLNHTHRAGFRLPTQTVRDADSQETSREVFAQQNELMQAQLKAAAVASEPVSTESC